MSSTTVKLQIPLAKSLRDKVEKHARAQGFSSLQDFTRVMYQTAINKNLEFTLFEREERLSPEAAARYEKALADLPRQLRKGEAKQFDTMEEFLADLKKL